MTNINNLEGIACPACGNDRRIDVWASTLAAVTDDGAEAYGDMEWDDERRAECAECRHAGRFGEFHLPHSTPISTQLKE